MPGKNIISEFLWIVSQFRVMGGWKSIPACNGRQVAYILDRSTVYHRANTHIETNTFTPTDNLGFQVN